jgi:hypothetical protein
VDIAQRNHADVSPAAKQVAAQDIHFQKRARDVTEMRPPVGYQANRRQEIFLSLGEKALQRLLPIR